MFIFCNLGGSGGASGSGASGSGAARKKNLKSHVWNYFSRDPTDDPSRINAHCVLCTNLEKNPEPFSMLKGGGTGTLNRHLVEKHNITKASHESGEARGGSSYNKRKSVVSCLQIPVEVCRSTIIKKN